MFRKKEIKAEIKTIKIKVKRTIDKWDPIDLLPFAPDDEYDSEIDSVSSFLISNRKEINENILGKQIYNVFIHYFGSDIFEKDIDECIEVAASILNEINENFKQIDNI